MGKYYSFVSQWDQWDLDEGLLQICKISSSGIILFSYDPNKKIMAIIAGDKKGYFQKTIL